jgi:hypothetical protein
VPGRGPGGAGPEPRSAGEQPRLAGPGLRRPWQGARRGLLEPRRRCPAPDANHHREQRPARRRTSSRTGKGTPPRPRSRSDEGGGGIVLLLAARAKPETLAMGRARATQVAQPAMRRAPGSREILPAMGRFQGRPAAPAVMGRGGVDLRNDGQGNGGRSLGSGLPRSRGHERPAVFLEHPPPHALWAPIRSPRHGGPIRFPLRSALGPPVALLSDPDGPDRRLRLGWRSGGGGSPPRNSSTCGPGPGTLTWQSAHARLGLGRGRPPGGGPSGSGPAFLRPQPPVHP